MWGTVLEQQAFAEIWPLWNGVPEARNRRRAVARLTPLAGLGYAPAQFALGMAYFDGDGARRYLARAFQRFSSAAQQAYPAAEGMLGNFYITHRPKHNVCDYLPEQAAAWHLRTARGGNAGAQYNLAFSYWTGRGLPPDALETYVWASLSVHCSSLRNRMAQVLRDQAVDRLEPEARAAADQRIAALSRQLPYPWSEPMSYWKLLAERAGVLKSSGDP